MVGRAAGKTERRRKTGTGKERKREIV